jgi:hypothetical protein
MSRIPDESLPVFDRLDPAAAGGDEALYSVNADGRGFCQIAQRMNYQPLSTARYRRLIGAPACGTDHTE